MSEADYGSYPTYNGSDTAPGSSWAYDPPSTYDSNGPRTGDIPNPALSAAVKPDATMQAYLATIYGRQANGGTAARTPSSSMATAQGAYSAATGGSYDPSTALTAYQQAQLNLSQQQLNQSAAQFQQTLANQASIAAGNLGFNYAQLGQQGNQFQQNYGIDYQQLLNATNGTPFQWAGLGLNAQQIDQQQNLDQQRIDLSRQLGQGDDARGWVQLQLASEAHDLQMMLGQGNLEQGRAETYATLTRLGIDVYQSDLNAQIARERMALDQQVEAARAGALSAQAAAEATRAAAAMRAVEVQLQLGNGDLALGHDKLAQAERFGLADINLRQEELGLKDKIATEDRQLSAFLGITGQQTQRDIASLQAQVQREGLGSQEKQAAWNVMKDLRGPRDWAQAVNVRRMMGDNPFGALAPGAGQMAGDIGGPSEPISWDTFLQDNGLPNYAQPGAGAGGFNINNTPWQQMTAGFGGGFQAPTANQPWMGQFGGAPTGGQSGLNYAPPGRYDTHNNLIPGSVNTSPVTAGPPQQNPALQGLPPEWIGWAPTPGYDPIGAGGVARFNERAPWADALINGQITPWQAWQLMPKATAQQWNGMSDEQKYASPWMNPFRRPEQVGTDDQNPFEQFGGMGIPRQEVNYRRTYNSKIADGSTPEEAAAMAEHIAGAWQQSDTQEAAQYKQYQESGGTAFADKFKPVQAQSLSQAQADPKNAWMFNIPGSDLAQRANAERATENMFGGLPQQETYRSQGGGTYSVPAGYGPQARGDVRVGGPALKALAEPLIKADGTVLMPDGTLQDYAGNVISKGNNTMGQGQNGLYDAAYWQDPAVQAYWDQREGKQTPSPASASGSFQAPTAGGTSPLSSQMGFTGNFMGIPVPQLPQLQGQPATAPGGTNSVAQQMIAQYMASYPTQQAQQSPQGQSALQFVTQMMNQARAQQAPVAATPPGSAAPPAPPAGTTTPPTMNTGQPPAAPPAFNNPSYSNWLPPAQGYYGGGIGGYTPDSPGVYSTGGPAMNPGLIPTEAGGATPIQFGSKTAVRSPLDAYATQQQTAAGLTKTGSTRPATQNTTAYNNAITGGPVPHITNPAVNQPAPTVAQWTNPNYAQPTQSTNMPTYPNLASTAQWGQDQHADFDPHTAVSGGYATRYSGSSDFEMPEPTGTPSPYNAYAAYGFPQYATGTPFVPETGPAIVHQGEAIVPADQNPYGVLGTPRSGWVDHGGDAEFNQRMNWLFAQQERDQSFAAPQVQQAAPPANPQNVNDLTNPQAPLQPNQQQMAANQQPANPMAPQPVANAPQHAQPTSPPTATVQTASPSSPGVQATTPAMQGIYDSLRAAGQAMGPIGNYSYEALLSQWNNRQAAPQTVQPGGGFQAPVATTPTRPQFVAPTPGFVAPSTNPAITALMSKLPAPQQVNYRTWAYDLAPSEREMALGEWERQGYFIPDVQQLIENNRLTRQQGAYAGGPGFIGR